MGSAGFQGLIVGLGNPGPQYRLTPHNFGFLVLEGLLASPECRWDAVSSPVSPCKFWRGVIEEKKWLAVQPLTYMNLSGKVVGPIACWYDLEPQQVLVIQDELDLPWGCMRFKQGGGAAGHKGVLSVAASLQSNAFYRLRIGIGRPVQGEDPAAYVLRRLPGPKTADMERIVSKAVDAVLSFCRQGPSHAIQALHAPRP